MSFAFIFIIVFQLNCISQNFSVNGIILDGGKNPVSFANISVVGKSISTVSDDDGRFILRSSNLTKGDVIVLQISKDGFKVSTKSLAVSSLPVIVYLTKTSAVPKKPSQPDSSAKHSSGVTIHQGDFSTAVVGDNNTINGMVIPPPQLEVNVRENNVLPCPHVQPSMGIPDSAKYCTGVDIVYKYQLSADSLFVMFDYNENIDYIMAQDLNSMINPITCFGYVDRPTGRIRGAVIPHPNNGHYYVLFYSEKPLIDIKNHIHCFVR